MQLIHAYITYTLSSCPRTAVVRTECRVFQTSPPPRARRQRRRPPRPGPTSLLDDHGHNLDHALDHHPGALDHAVDHAVDGAVHGALDDGARYGRHLYGR